MAQDGQRVQVGRIGHHFLAGGVGDHRVQGARCDRIREHRDKVARRTPEVTGEGILAGEQVAGYREIRFAHILEQHRPRFQFLEHGGDFVGLGDRFCHAHQLAARFQFLNVVSQGHRRS